MSLREGIPAFVTRGLMTLSDPRDLGTVRYANEADLRDAMALHWWLHGWTVRTEIKVPDCGRIDVLATGPTQRVIVELKRKILTPTEARMAFQQAHAYAAYLTTGQTWKAHVFVTAGDMDYAATRAAEAAFPDVFGSSFLHIAGHSSNHGVMAGDGAYLARIARNRRDELAHLLELARGAAGVMTNRTELHLVEEAAS